MTIRAHNLWVYVRRAEDTPDCWVATCLNWGFVALGQDPNIALKACLDLLAEVAAENHEAATIGKRARPELWAAMSQVLENGVPVGMSEILLSPLAEMDCFVTQVHVFSQQLTVSQPATEAVSLAVEPSLPRYRSGAGEHAWSCSNHGHGAMSASA